MAPTWEPLYDEILDAVTAVTGKHAGHRALHAKGTLLAGEFTPSPEAADLTTAPHLQGDSSRATVRFSNGNGDPTVPDAAQDGRGIAVKLYLDEGATTDLLAISRSTFMVRTPEDFLEFMRARKPEPDTGEPNLEVLGAWLGEHPEAQVAVQEQFASKPPVSYAQLAYNSIHAFRFTAPDGTERWVRYRFEPEAGEATLTEEEGAEREPDYLQAEILERVEKGAAAFALYAVIGGDDDDPDDPTVAWPDERERVQLGRLVITGRETQRETGGDVLVFDPTRVPPGIECSADKILHARSPAYSASVARRTA